MEYEDEFGYGEEKNFEPDDDDIYDTFMNFKQEYVEYYNYLLPSSSEIKLQDIENRLAENPSRDEKKRLELSKKKLEQQLREEDEYGREILKKTNNLNDIVEKYVSFKEEELDKIISSLKKIDFWHSFLEI